MPANAEDALTRLSDALAARAAAASTLAVCVQTAGTWPRSGTLWRADVVVASEQVFPTTGQAEIHFADGRRVTARVAGRDPGTNIVALRLEAPVETALLPPAAPRLGEIALALSASTGGEPAVRMGVVRGVGPAWSSLNGGRIDQRISLDLILSRGEEGGPALAAAGGLLGMTAAGPRGRALVIPAATIERILDPLLAAGRIERGWLGVALHPVALPDAIRAQIAQERGLMVMQVAPEGPAAVAGVLAGDILVAVDALPASRPRAISRQLGADSIGKAVVLQLVRSGAPLTLTATVTARPTG